MGSERPSQRAFLGASALLFAVSAVLATVWCAPNFVMEREQLWTFHTASVQTFDSKARVRDQRVDRPIQVASAGQLPPAWG